MKNEEMETVGELIEVCAQLVFLIPACTVHVTKWNRACDKRLARLISYIHHTLETTDNIVMLAMKQASAN